MVKISKTHYKTKNGLIKKNPIRRYDWKLELSTSDYEALMQVKSDMEDSGVYDKLKIKQTKMEDFTGNQIYELWSR